MITRTIELKDAMIRAKETMILAVSGLIPKRRGPIFSAAARFLQSLQ
jgi:hypothetical protein